MSNEILVPTAEQVINDTVEVPTPTPTPEFVYEYQAVDKVGRPLGAKQIFKGATVQEVLDKVADANKNLISLNRELNRRIRLGEFEPETLPQEAVRLNSDSLDFTSQDLTAEEIGTISRDLLDPAKTREAGERLVESTIGMKSAVLRETLAKQQQEIAMLKAQREADAFVSANPEYYVCKENFEVITNWMVRNDLAPIRQNFQLAYDKLKAVGLLLEAPIVREEVVPVRETVEQPTTVNSQPSQEEPSRITTEEPAQRTRSVVRQPSGLTRTIASEVGTQPQRQTITLEDIERMPSDIYKRRILTDPSFAKAVNELYAPKPRN